MTAPLFWVPSDRLAGVEPDGVVRLDGDEGHHAVRVRRVAAGEEVILADGAGRGVRGEVAVVASGGLEVLVREVVAEPVSLPAFVLVQALAKSRRDEAAVEAATELGVDAVIAWQAERSIVRWRPERAEKSLAKWGHVATAAAKQARRLRVPQVSGPLDIRALVRRIREAVGQPCGGAAYLLHESATQPLAGITLPASGEVLLVVGPEGGIATAELEAMTAAGAVPVRLGQPILRASTAGPAALAVLSAQARWH